MKHPDLAAAVEHYCEKDDSRAVRPLDVAGHCGVTQHAAEGVVNTLRNLEAVAGEEQSNSYLLKGTVEGDAHGIRSCWISNSNPHFAKELAKARAEHPGKRPKAWRLWVNILYNMVVPRL